MTLAKQWAVSTLVAGSIAIAAIAVWELRTVLTLVLLAFAAYWIVERRRALALLAGLGRPRKRKTIVDTWLVVESLLGAYVRRVFVVVLFVSTVLSTLYVLLGVPEALLVGPFSGVVEL